MTDYDLKLGERLEILRDERRGVSNIQMITPDERLVISEPACGMGRLPVHVDDTLRLFYFRSFGMLSCVTTVERIFEENGLTLIELEIRSQISRYQRRDFVRFDTLLPVSLVPLTDVPNAAYLGDAEAAGLIADRRLPEEDVTGALRGFSMDLSGGGLRFICKEALAVGTLADCSIDLNEGDKVVTAVRIVRCETDPHSGSGGKYLLGAKFIGIEEPLRNRVVKYIFNEQLRRRSMAGRGA